MIQWLRCLLGIDLITHDIICLQKELQQLREEREMDRKVIFDTFVSNRQDINCLTTEIVNLQLKGMTHGN